MSSFGDRYPEAAAALCAAAPAVAVLLIAAATLGYPAADTLGTGVSLALFCYYVAAIVVILNGGGFAIVVRSVVTIGLLAAAVAASFEAEALYTYAANGSGVDWSPQVAAAVVVGLETLAATLLLLLAVPFLVEVLRRSAAPFAR